MSEQNNATALPTVEDKIKEVLGGDALKNALDFIAFLRENGISLDHNAGETEKNNAKGWNGAVGGIVGNSIGYLYISGDENCPGPWTFWFNSCDFEGSDSADDEFKNAIWAFASPCGRCSENWEKCRGSGKRTILGKEFENQCHSPLMFTNPDAGTLENMKKFLLYLKPEIDCIQAGIEREKAAVKPVTETASESAVSPAAESTVEPDAELAASPAAKPTIEDALNNILSGDTLANALDFVAFLKASGFTNDGEYNCNFEYKGEPTCVILCHEHKDYPTGLWGIYNYPTCEYDGFPLDESQKEFARANVRICVGECGCRNWPRGGDQTVYGKEYMSVCSSVICFFNPDAEALEKIKKLFINWMLIIDDIIKNKVE